MRPKPRNSRLLLITLLFPSVLVAELPSITGLRLHLDASNRETLELNNQKSVQEWSNAVQPDIHFTPPEKAPRYVPQAANGKPAIHFGGDTFLSTDSYAALAMTTDLTGVTIFAVGRYTGTGTQTYFRIGEGRSGNALRLMLERKGAELRMLARRWDRSDFEELEAQGTPANEWSIDAGTIDYINGRAAMFINGKNVAEKETFLTPGRTSPVRSHMFHIGKDHNQHNWKGEIAELLIFNRVLTQDEMAEVGTYLSEKYELDYDQSPYFSDPELSAEQIAKKQTHTISQEELDMSLRPATINTNPGPEYSDEARNYAMVIGLDRSPGGRLWAAWVAGDDSEEGYFVISTSDDNGDTWSEPRMVIDPPNHSEHILQRTLVGTFWTDPNGRLWLFYDQSLGYFDGRAGVWAITCDNPDDENPTWSEPRRIWHGATLNKPLVLDNGEWLLPISLWTRDWIRTHLSKAPAEPFEDLYRELDPLRMAHLFVSTDEGETWTLRGSVAAEQRRFDEHMPVKLSDGRLWMPIRTYYGLAETYSSDNGRTWSEPVPSRLKHVARGSRIHLRRLDSGRLLLVKHGQIEEQTSHRSHLMAFLSDDDGKTWSDGLMLDERRGVSYPDGFQGPDGMIHIIYDRNRSTDSEILMARFREDDILKGSFHTPDAAERILVNKALGD